MNFFVNTEIMYFKEVKHTKTWVNHKFFANLYFVLLHMARLRYVIILYVMLHIETFITILFVIMRYIYNLVFIYELITD